MTEISRPWSGTTVGDAGPYTAINWWDVWQSLCAGSGSLGGSGNKGVFWNIPGQLEVTYVSPNFLSVAAGAALIDGLFYNNTAAYSATVTSASAGNVRDDRLVVRKYFSGAIQTARIVLLPGSEAASPGPGTPPALTQDATRITYWDLPLARVSIADNGVITLTDEREPIVSSGVVLLDTTIVTDPAGEIITWADIPQCFSDLLVRHVGRCTAYGFGLVASAVKVQFNDDTDANHYADSYEFYNYEAVGTVGHHHYGDSAGLGLTIVNPDNDPADTFATGEFHVIGYSKILAYHPATGVGLCPYSADSFICRHGSYNPDSATAITKMVIQNGVNYTSGNYNFAVGSEFRLYGIL